MNNLVTAGPIWHSFMETALKDTPAEIFDKPIQDPNYDKLPPVLRGYWQGNESFVTDTISGKLATPLTPKNTRKEYVITDVHDILHWISKDNPLGGVPANPSDDPLYYNFETGVKNWWANNSYRFPVVSASQKPAGFDDVHTTENAPEISIISPTPESSFASTSPINISVISTKETSVLQKIDVFLNNTYIGTGKGNPATFSFNLNGTPAVTEGENTIMVMGTDTIGNTATTSVPIKVSF
jgi:hypothetical protein